jgi:hypothetical protein
MRRATSCRRGFTLIELTLAVAMLVTLSFVLFGFLRGGMGMYRSGEARRDTYERAQVLLEQLTRDLRCVAAPLRGDPGEAPGIRLLGDRDDEGRPRLRFVRFAGEERFDRVLRAAGTRPGAEAYVDLRDDVREAAAGELRAPAGLMEVAYVAAPLEGGGSVWLWRGVRSPIGGPGSLFRPENLPVPNEPPPPTLQPMTGGVLHLGFRFRGRASDGSLAWMDSWDSTRGVDPRFERYAGASSLEDPRDDVLPGAIEVRFLLEEPQGPATRLTRSVAEHAEVLPVNSTKLLSLDSGGGLVLVEGEWMRVAVRDPGSFTIVERGLLGSATSPHPVRARVRTGSLFRRVIDVPTTREDWNE